METNTASLHSFDLLQKSENHLLYFQRLVHSLPKHAECTLLPFPEPIPALSSLNAGFRSAIQTKRRWPLLELPSRPLDRIR